jgi:hypothetical protein
MRKVLLVLVIMMVVRCDDLMMDDFTEGEGME